MKSAWALLVVSAEKQTETLAYQRAWAEQTAAEKGWTLTRTFEDDSSGKLGTRALVKKLLAELRSTPRESRPHRLLMIRLDRLGRGDDGGVDTLQTYKEIIRDLGVTIHTREDGDLSFGRVTDLLMPFMRLFVGAFENENRRDKAVAVYKRKREAGQAIGNKRPYGLEIGPDGKDRAKEPQAEAVRLAFALRLQGLGHYAIAGRLAAAAPPQQFKSGKEQQLHWSNYRVRAMLANRAYVGVVVDEVTFARAQQMRKEHIADAAARADRRHPWPLSGTLRCYCGYRVIGRATGKGSRFRYYGCRARWNHQDRYRLVRADRLEAEFVRLLNELTADPSLLATYRRANTTASPTLIERTMRTARAELAESERKRERVWDLHDKGLVPDQEMRERLEVIATERTEIQGRIATLEDERAMALASRKSEVDAQAVIAQAAAAYEGASVEDQRRLAAVVALYLGGLYIGEDKALKVGRPPMMGEQRRLRSPNA